MFRGKCDSKSQARPVADPVYLSGARSNLRAARSLGIRKNDPVVTALARGLCNIFLMLVRLGKLGQAGMPSVCSLP